MHHLKSGAGFGTRLRKDLRANYLIYLMVLPALAWFLIFYYGPYFGLIVAFKDYRPALGILESPWAGLKHFKAFIEGFYFTRLMGNTLILNAFNLLFGFPAPIIFALFLNELRAAKYKRVVQTVTYLPHFISVMVVAGIIRSFCETDGLFNQILGFFNPNHVPEYLLQVPANFRPIYIGSGIWQGFGFGSIIYLSALSGIDSQLYEAAVLDGAGRLRQTWHVTLPGIAPTIIILFIMSFGNILSTGWEKIVLLYNDAIISVSDVIDSFVYRRGFLEANYSLGTAVGLFKQVISIILLVIVNTVSRRLTEQSLW